MTDPYYSDDYVTLWHGDCLEVLATLPDASVHAIVTDPPYGLEFMGKEWDSFKTGRAAKYAAGGSLDIEGMAAQSGKGGAGPSYVNRPAKRCAICDKQAWSGSPCRCDEPEWVMDNSPLHAFQEWCEAWARECLRVLKPGGHLLAFGGTRTWHRLACAVEDAGFEMRDSIAWLYGSGFPKSLDVSKAIDKGSGQNRARQLEFTEWMRSTGITSSAINDATGSNMGGHYLTDAAQPAIATADMFDALRHLLPEVPERIERLVAERTGITWTDYVRRPITRHATRPNVPGEVISFDQRGSAERERRDVAASAASERWQGWGTALKPAFEPVVVARKPLAGTVAANVLAHGTGALNVDACRVGSPSEVMPQVRPTTDTGGGSWPKGEHVPFHYPPGGGGRWPANVVLDDTAAAELDRQSGTLTSGVLAAHHKRAPKSAGILGAYGSAEGERGFGDQGGASRFFYVAKAPTSERPRVGGIAHPTVKPLDLMRWLVRLVTPPGGTVLEPFAGSGTTAEACVLEGFQCIAIEREADYLPLIVSRLDKPVQLGLNFEEPA